MSKLIVYTDKERERNKKNKKLRKKGISISNTK